jgi:HEAT repeat protein
LVQPLVDALKDKAISVRQGAAKALGAQRDARAVPALLRVLHDAAEDSGVRYAAACALGEIGEARSLDDLLAVFKNQSLPDGVRGSAAHGLALSRERRFVEPLVAVAKDGKEASDFRGRVVEAIADLDGSRAIPFLTEIATTKTEDEHVRCRAALCVVKLTEGAVDDVGIVAAIQGRYRIRGDESIHGVVVASDVLEKAALAVADHGKTEAVRAAAAALLKKWGRTVSPSTDDADRPSPGMNDAPSPRKE